MSLTSLQIKEEANDSVESIPAAPEVIDVEDSGDSESDSDEESEEHDAAPEILLNEANAQNYAIFEALPPEQKEEAKRQFPDFWRTYQAVRYEIFYSDIRLGELILMPLKLVNGIKS